MVKCINKGWLPGYPLIQHNYVQSCVSHANHLGNKQKVLAGACATVCSGLELRNVYLLFILQVIKAWEQGYRNVLRGLIMHDVIIK